MKEDTSYIPDVATQNKKLYAYLVNGGAITTLSAMTSLHIGCLTKRISDLIQKYNVPIHKEKVKNSSGRGHHGRYTMIKENREILKGICLECVERLPNLIYQRGSEPRGIHFYNNVVLYEDDLKKEKAIKHL